MLPAGSLNHAMTGPAAAENSSFVGFEIRLVVNFKADATIRKLAYGFVYAVYREIQDRKASHGSAWDK